jgi:chromosomal replication initiation ATPase DnaA
MYEYSSNHLGKYDQKTPQSSIFSEKTSAKRAELWARQAAEVRLTCDAVAKLYNILTAELDSPTRGEAHVAHARQLAMYLSHVTFGMSLGAVGRHFGRDRTTAAYACRQVEDRRDNPRFDLMLDRLEHALKAMSLARFDS